jgi:hypothetical protein
MDDEDKEKEENLDKEKEETEIDKKELDEESVPEEKDIAPENVSQEGESIPLEDEISSSSVNMNKNASENREGAKKKNPEEIKQLRNVLLVIGFFTLMFLGIFIFVNSVRYFTYEGVDFNVVKEGELILYQTSLPVKVTDKTTGAVVKTDYNFYFRNDPRKLDDIVFDGKINIRKEVIMNFTENFNCDGDGVIAVANMMNLFGILKINAETNDSLGCNKNSQYTFLMLQGGNETGIEQVHTNCYDLTINNCEVLEVTEKYLIKMLIKLNQDI